MTQWVGDNWRLRAGPQPDSTLDQNVSTDDDTKVDPELRLRGYKESFVREYDGIRVYHHQGRYQHQTEQFHYWAFYEYRMMINSECWNVITDEDMVKPPSSFPGSNSAKLTHDFCHLETRYCDDEYTSFSFVHMTGHKIWPFYTSENFQEHLWIWVSPRRFAIISGHPTNEKLNHFYSNKMHEHHILANRTICWSVDTVVNDNGKVIGRTIAPVKTLASAVRLMKPLLQALKTNTLPAQVVARKTAPMGSGSTRTPQGRQERNILILPIPTVHAICRRGMKPLQIHPDRRQHQQANHGSQ